MCPCIELSLHRLKRVTVVVAAALAGCAAAPPASAPSAPAASAPTLPASPAASAAPASAPVSDAPPVRPIDAATREQRFAAWLDAFRGAALAAGIDDATAHAALDDARYLPRVVDLDRAQPEFTRTVWAYLDGTVTAQRVAQGRAKLAAVRAEAAAAAARYGVPPAVLVAIWGMETNYGGNVGGTRTIDALATLGFDGRREDWARSELLAALRILQNGDIDGARMIGSWAGAMGQTQFLPSNFLRYAVDADGDGRRDIWGSMADVMASTANFLAQSGWQRDEPWGLEVRLPPGFDLGRADADVRQPSDAWAAEGVQAMDGSTLPAIADAAILLPAGARGPAFLVGAGFRAILRYNNSTSYALAVGLLAQRLDGGPGVQASWPRELAALTRSQLLELQTLLNQRGFPSGTPDGAMGPDTRRGIRLYQRSIGAPADGYPTTDLLDRLRQP